MARHSKSFNNKGVAPKKERLQQDKKQSKKPIASSSSSSSSSSSMTASVANRPRNHMIKDATTPFEYTFVRYGQQHTVTVHQTPAEESWPGGALWDLGVLLSHVLVLGFTCGASLGKNKHNGVIVACPPSLQRNDIVWKHTTVLELGCGVGLTGLVAAALGAHVTLLTDLDVVIQTVTKRNVEENTMPGPNKSCVFRSMKSGGKVMALPLCWGNDSDEASVHEWIDDLSNSAGNSKQSRASRTLASKQKSKAFTSKENAKPQSTSTVGRQPDLIIIGDVAYQHKPGAPSHFDALVATLLSFLGDNTLVLFGTRMRMPASTDLLQMFREHMDEEAIAEAHELDPSLAELKQKHNMTIHLLRKKRQPVTATSAD